MSLSTDPTLTKTATRQVMNSVGHDFLVGGITLAAILLLVGTGTAWLRSILGFTNMVGQSQSAVAGTLLLNIALILFGWRRYRDLRSEVVRRTLAEAKALELAQYDALTGFLNRRALDEIGSARLAEWRAAGHSVAALVIDLDSFKSINDLYGHAGGDRLLKETANRIARACPPSALCARLGGDEFAVLLPLPTEDHEALHKLGEALVSFLTDPVQIEALAASTSSSLGGALADNPSITIEQLLRNADAAMYQSKRLGRSRYTGFDASMGEALAKRDRIEGELRLALASNALYPVYEPLIDLASGEPVGYEMLARWHSSSLGIVPPSDFIPVAEEKGLISALSDQMFRRAFADAILWPADLSLSINVSPLQLRDPWFAQKLLKLLAETGFPAQRLILEITESAIVDNLPMAQTIFTSLRNQGIRMALDDFGTGYSSIASLRALPFDSVKIDREFIAQMSKHQAPDSVAEAVLQLGKSLGLPVVAEGIECDDTARRLSELSCAIGQGHYFGGALTAEMVQQRHTEVAPNLFPELDHSGHRHSA
ncbi:EAL domain-containing protein [Sphingomonas lacunae]|uniref:EAL domain-containing protein n=1 Tax=Sphingomonas lacunae TaxID=2698828 RepID=A0A6M4AVA1_9SPHN|nr:EAL domain-containing protein [Sphingomonas lacunae]QJQ32994.1 EAL domain-containing protein [Sphingomonas lacunae]